MPTATSLATSTEMIRHQQEDGLPSAPTQREQQETNPTVPDPWHRTFIIIYIAIISVCLYDAYLCHGYIICDTKLPSRVLLGHLVYAVFRGMDNEGWIAVVFWACRMIYKDILRLLAFLSESVRSLFGLVIGVCYVIATEIVACSFGLYEFCTPVWLNRFLKAYVPGWTKGLLWLAWSGLTNRDLFKREEEGTEEGPTERNARAESHRWTRLMMVTPVKFPGWFPKSEKKDESLPKDATEKPVSVDTSPTVSEYSTPHSSLTAPTTSPATASGSASAQTKQEPLSPTLADSQQQAKILSKTEKLPDRATFLSIALRPVSLSEIKPPSPEPQTPVPDLHTVLQDFASGKSSRPSHKKNSEREDISDVFSEDSSSYVEGDADVSSPSPSGPSTSSTSLDPLSSHPHLYRVSVSDSSPAQTSISPPQCHHCKTPYFATNADPALPPNRARIEAPVRLPCKSGCVMGYECAQELFGVAGDGSENGYPARGASLCPICKEKVIDEEDEKETVQEGEDVSGTGAIGAGEEVEVECQASAHAGAEVEVGPREMVNMKEVAGS